MFVQRNGKDRPVVTHTGNNSGLLLNQPSRFHEQKVSSFGKPLLHHALVKKQNSSLCKQGLIYWKRTSLLDRTIIGVSWSFPRKAKNSLAVLKAKQIRSLSSATGVRSVAPELLAFSLPTQDTVTSCQLSGAQERCLQDQELAQAWTRGLLGSLLFSSNMTTLESLLEDLNFHVSYDVSADASLVCHAHGTPLPCSWGAAGAWHKSELFCLTHSYTGAKYSLSAREYSLFCFLLNTQIHLLLDPSVAWYDWSLQAPKKPCVTCWFFPVHSLYIVLNLTPDIQSKKWANSTGQFSVHCKYFLRGLHEFNLTFISAVCNSKWSLSGESLRS